MKLFPRRFLSLSIVLLSIVAFSTESVVFAAPVPQASTRNGKKKKGSGNASSATSKKAPAKKSGNGQGTAKKAPAKTGTKKGTSASKTKGKGNASSAKKETSADVRKRQEETRREIQRTQEELKRNEAEMKKSLGDLGRINADIEKSRGEVASLQGAVGTLDRQINSLTKQITDNEAKLSQMRAEYLKAVKKMRTARGNTSALAFIFSSDSFNQAMRRMRYLRQFSAWKDKQSAEINRKVAQLNDQKKSLAAARMQKDDALRKEQIAKAELEKKGREQDAVVADLKRNGDLLTVHLSKKQQEANVLKSRIASLIAEEERKAAAEREAAQRREAERKAAEKAAAEKAAAEKAAAERAAAERERQLAQAEPAKETPAPKAETPKKTETPKKETPKKGTPKKQEPAKGGDKKGDEGKSYADARRRKPRSDSGTPAPKAETPKKEVSKPAPASKPVVADGGFAGMKGALPRPVDGSWRVTSRFGRQELPDLPGVVYDNPGINVEVPIGATVKSVYAGKISGVYMVPGFQTVVIVNHGNYYTAYGNLKSPAVKVGDAVKAGQKLGSVAENMDDPGHGELHFEVYRNRDKLNPLDWIR